MAAELRDTQRAILDAALIEVLEHGIRRTTAADIARRGGISRQTVYRYWPDTQAVFGALITRELLATLPAAGEAGSLDELADLLTDTAETIRQLPILARLRDTDPQLFARYILHRLGTSQRAIIADLTERLRAGQTAGFVRAGDPRRLAVMVLLIAQSAIQSAPLVAEWLDDGAWRDEMRHAMTGYLRRGEA